MTSKWVWPAGLLLTLICASTALGLEYQWPDYSEPMETTIKVPLYGGSKLTVELPQEFIAASPTVRLHMDIESNFFYSIDGFSERSFEGFLPKISVNGAFIFGSYRIPVRPLPGRQTIALEIDTDYLKPGVNQLKIYAGQEPGITYSCAKSDNCLCFVLYKLWFESER